MQRSEKQKLVEKLRRAADAQRRAYPGNIYHDGEAQGLDMAAGIIGKIRCEEVPEWCTDCKEYDAEAKSCHRFSRVIRTAMEEAKVIRCKDCKWCGSPSHCPDRDGLMDYEGFCSWGERRETDE